MNEYNDDAFNNVIKGLDDSPYQQPTSAVSGTYGIPANSIPAKPGMTRRGKAALAIGTAVLATSGLVFWQHSTAVEAASQAKQQEIQLENKKLDLEMLKEINRASTGNAKSKNSEDVERQKQIAECVNTDKGLVGKQMGVTYSSVLKDCQAQNAAASADDMQTAASASDTGSSGGHVNGSLVIGGLVLAGGIVLVARRRTTVSNAQ